MDFVEILPLLMFAALAVLLFTGYPVAFVLGGVALGFGLIGYFFDAFSLNEFFNIMPRVWGGVAENLILTAVPMFIFMGTMLERSNVARDLLQTLSIMLRRVPGGLALAVTLMGTILAATTGIIGASVVMMTLLALPVMMENRYSHALATGTIASSGTLGILIPPSIMLVIMADLLSVSVGNLFVAALLPGLLLSGLYVVYIVTVSGIKPTLAPRIDESKLEDVSGYQMFRSFVPPVVLIVLVLGSIFAGWATPTEAAAVGGAGATALAAFNRQLSWAVLKDVCERTGLTIAMIFFIFIGATAFSYVFGAMYGDDIIIEIIHGMGLGSWGILFVLMGLVFILGFFFDWVEITLIVLPVFGPVIEQLDFAAHIADVDKVYWFAILVAVNLQTSFLTPPFGFALFYMKGVAPPEIKIQSIYKGIIPFVVLQLGGLSAVMYWPEIAMWLPRVAFGE